MTRFCSIFNQLLQLFPRAEFQQAVIDDAGGAARARLHVLGAVRRDAVLPAWAAPTRCARSAAAWRVARASWRISGSAAPPRSTLAYANAHRPWQLYQAVFYQLLARCREVAGPKKFRFKNKLLSLDATVIDLCAEMFPTGRRFGARKGAVKLHFTLDHDGYLPTVLVITEGKRHDVPVARQQTLRAGHDPGVRQGLHRLSPGSPS